MSAKAHLRNLMPPLDLTKGSRSRIVGPMALGLTAFAVSYILSGYAPGLLTKSQPAAPPGMVWVPGGEFTMGTDADLGWPDEKPAHRVRVDGFWMDETDVTNAQFRRFVEATGYITTAERTRTLEEIMSHAPPGARQP